MFQLSWCNDLYHTHLLISLLKNFGARGSFIFDIKFQFVLHTAVRVFVCTRQPVTPCIVSIIGNRHTVWAEFGSLVVRTRGTYRHHWLKNLKTLRCQPRNLHISKWGENFSGEGFDRSESCVCQDNLKRSKCRIKGSVTCPSTDENFWIKFLKVVSCRHGVLLKTNK
jgi:hypothetical protein